MVKKAKILCVDDEAIVRLTLESLLADRDVELLFADNGQAGLEMARQSQPDAILLDIMMPGMDGYEVCRQVRADPLLAEVPVVMITALDSLASRLAGLDAGADDFLTKPFDSTEIQIRIQNILRLNRYRSLVTERARFLWLVEHAEDGYLILSKRNTIQYANPSARLLLRLPDNYLNTNFSSQVELHYQVEPAEFWNHWAEDPQTCYLVQPETAAARTCWLQISATETSLGEDNHRTVRLQDVTEKMLVDQDMCKFHTVVAHKLRTPASQIYASMALLVENLDAFDVEEMKSLIKISWQGSERLLRDVRDILGYIDAPLALKPGACIALGEVSSMAEKIACEHEIENVTVEMPQKLSSRLACISMNVMELILHELLENARKFHPGRAPQLQIDIHALGDNKVLIRIADDGLTLTAEQLRAAWLPYFQGEKHFSGETPGMGLGLPTVASLVWQAGGQVRLSNREVGSGVQVDVTLPMIGETD